MINKFVHWRNNCFKIPLGNAGKSLVDELCRLYSAFAEASALECVALRATVVLPIVVLRQPHRRSKPKELTACLERRLKVWKDGDLESLVERVERGEPSNIALVIQNLIWHVALPI